MVDVSICICTFQRPEGLLRLLRSLLRLEPGSPAHEVIVADNDAARSGEPAVRQAEAEGLAVRYLVEPLRGIARARNRSLEPATGTYVAFIDDDEEADPAWLARLWREVRRQDHDGGVGPIIPRFHEETPRWLIHGGFFERPRLPTGTILAAYQTRTGNALIRRESLTAEAGPFDVSFDSTGGEDTDLFRRLIAADRRIIAVDSALVYEHLPPNRTTVRWLLRRRFNIGVIIARRDAIVGQQQRWPRAQPLAAGLASGALGMLLFPLLRISGLKWMVIAARDLGRFAFNSGLILRQRP